MTRQTVDSVDSNSLPQERSPLSYLAVAWAHGDKLTPAQAQIMTPRMMRWGDDVWLLDMGTCATYWRVRAESLGVSLSELLKRLLEELTGEAAAELQAVHGQSPWQSLLILEHMRARGLTGLVHGDGPFGRRLFRELPWELFWRQAECAAGHLGSLPEGRRRPESFRGQAARMRRAVKRLGLKAPWDLHEASPESVKRRFGSVMRDLWEWTYGEEGDQEALFVSGFPWVPERFPDPPQVTRHLDHPVVEWAHMEPLLKEDFDRLCSWEGFHAGERVVSLEWRIVFRDTTHLVIPILFRHPHSLHLERSHHGTALLQALYSFESSLTDSPLDRRRLKELIPIEPVVSWTVTLSERLTVPDRWRALFAGEEDHGSIDTGGVLLSLENRLSIPLQSYRLRHDWAPEDSFACMEEGKSENKDHENHDMDPGALPSLLATARDRPLFLFRQPAALEHSGRSSVFEFTERTMAKWWSCRDPHNPDTWRSLQRDYYRVTDGRGRTFWVYRNAADAADKFYIHGVFG